MNKKAKIEKIISILNELYPTPAIPLKHTDPYTLLIAVLLSAQCTDKRVNEITPLLFARANTPKKMIKLSVGEIKKIIKPCGLSNNKAKAIHRLSEIIINEYNGNVPHTFEELERLPGVGHKTASVVIAQAFKMPAFPIDTHIFRCAIRWGLSKAKTVVGVEKDLKKVFLKKDWINVHLQIIYFAREFCPARGHNIEICPICSWIKKS